MVLAEDESGEEVERVAFRMTNRGRRRCRMRELHEDIKDDRVGEEKNGCEILVATAECSKMEWMAFMTSGQIEDYLDPDS